MILNGQVTVGTVATYIGQPSIEFMQTHIHNNDNTDIIYLGGPNVTTSNGLGLFKLDSFETVVGPNDQIFAVSAKNSHLVSYMMVSV